MRLFYCIRFMYFGSLFGSYMSDPGCILTHLDMLTPTAKLDSSLKYGVPPFLFIFLIFSKRNLYLLLFYLAIISEFFLATIHRYPWYSFRHFWMVLTPAMHNNIGNYFFELYCSQNGICLNLPFKDIQSPRCSSMRLSWLRFV